MGHQIISRMILCKNRGSIFLTGVHHFFFRIRTELNYVSVKCSDYFIVKTESQLMGRPQQTPK